MVSCLRLTSALAAVAFMATAPAFGQAKYDTGASDTEIKIGSLMPFSGPASAYSVIGKAEAAYFRYLNSVGGINGRKINLIAYDDSYSPPKAVEQVRKLVESDEVLLVFSPLGTPTNAAIQKLLNAKRIPQLFVASGAARWNDPKNFPWTMGWAPNYQSEGSIYGKYILRVHGASKIGAFYQNDDYGKDFLKGLKDGLGAKARSLMALEESYETTEPVVDSHIAKLKASGADVILLFATPRFAAQALRRIHEMAWQPTIILNSVSASIGSVLKPVGLDAVKGVVSATYAKDPSDPQWKDDPGVQKFQQFLSKEYPDADREDLNVVLGYSLAQTMAIVLQRCGDDLTRANVMRQAAALQGVELDALLPGIRLNTSAADFRPIKQVQLMRFDGVHWVLFGDVLSDDGGER